MSQPLENAAPAKAPALKGGPLAKLAGMWEEDPDFKQFLKDCFGYSESPRAIILQACGIDSRRLLDHNSRASAAFNEFIREPYMQWQKARGLPA